MSGRSGKRHLLVRCEKRVEREVSGLASDIVERERYAPFERHVSVEHVHRRENVVDVLVRRIAERLEDSIGYGYLRRDGGVNDLVNAPCPGYGRMRDYLSGRIELRDGRESVGST